MGKISEYPTAIAFAKGSVVVKSSNSQNHVKNVYRSTLECFCAKNN